MPQLVLGDVCFDLQVREFVTQSLSLNPQGFSFLLAHLNLGFEHHRSFDGDVVFGLEILKRRRCISGLPLEIVVGNLNIS